MRLIDKHVVTHIADDNPIAIKIRQGYEYSIAADGTITLGGQTGPDIDQVISLLRSSDPVPQAVLKKILLFIIKRLLRDGF